MMSEHQCITLSTSSVRHRFAATSAGWLAWVPSGRGSGISASVAYRGLDAAASVIFAHAHSAQHLLLSTLDAQKGCIVVVQAGEEAYAAPVTVLNSARAPAATADTQQPRDVETVLAGASSRLPVSHVLWVASVEHLPAPHAAAWQEGAPPLALLLVCHGHGAATGTQQGKSLSLLAAYLKPDSATGLPECVYVVLGSVALTGPHGTSTSTGTTEPSLHIRGTPRVASGLLLQHDGGSGAISVLLLAATGQTLHAAALRYSPAPARGGSHGGSHGDTHDHAAATIVAASHCSLPSDVRAVQCVAGEVKRRGALLGMLALAVTTDAPLQFLPALPGVSASASASSGAAAGVTSGGLLSVAAVRPLPRASSSVDVPDGLHAAAAPAASVTPVFRSPGLNQVLAMYPSTLQEDEQDDDVAYQEGEGEDGAGMVQLRQRRRRRGVPDGAAASTAAASADTAAADAAGEDSDIEDLDTDPIIQQLIMRGSISVGSSGGAGGVLDHLMNISSSNDNGSGSSTAALSGMVREAGHTSAASAAVGALRGTTSRSAELLSAGSSLNANDTASPAAGAQLHVLELALQLPSTAAATARTRPVVQLLLSGSLPLQLPARFADCLACAPDPISAARSGSRSNLMLLVGSSAAGCQQVQEVEARVWRDDEEEEEEEEEGEDRGLPSLTLSLSPHTRRVTLTPTLSDAGGSSSGHVDAVLAMWNTSTGTAGGGGMRAVVGVTTVTAVTEPDAVAAVVAGPVAGPEGGEEGAAVRRAASASFTSPLQFHKQERRLVLAVATIPSVAQRHAPAAPAAARNAIAPVPTPAPAPAPTTAPAPTVSKAPEQRAFGSPARAAHPERVLPASPAPAVAATLSPLARAMASLSSPRSATASAAASAPAAAVAQSAPAAASAASPASPASPAPSQRHMDSHLRASAVSAGLPVSPIQPTSGAIGSPGHHALALVPSAAASPALHRHRALVLEATAAAALAQATASLVLREAAATESQHHAAVHDGDDVAAVDEESLAVLQRAREMAQRALALSQGSLGSM